MSLTIEEIKDYIIPIWNWSSSLILLSLFIKCITLFLYGIGALLSPLQNIFIYVITLFLYGIGASWYNWQNFNVILITLFLYGIGAKSHFASMLTTVSLHYSYMELELYNLTAVYPFLTYYIIPIWNWSYVFLKKKMLYLFITLFLYGIGAISLALLF